MNKPTWVTVVGIMCIIFGCTGLFGALQFIILPYMIDMQRSILNSVDDLSNAPDEVFDVLNRMMDLPRWFYSASIFAGIIGFILSGFYLYTSIMFITVKKNADKLMIFALILMMFYAVIKIVLGAFAGTLLAISISFSALISFIIDLILMIVIVASDKKVFQSAFESTQSRPSPQ